MKKTTNPLPHYRQELVNGRPYAWIVDPKDKGRKRIYPNNKVYLDNGSEFVIELFNPLQDSVLTELKINGKLAASTGLILRPGERFYLDCFIDDKKKFVFKTYEVESDSKESQKAIENNGFIQVNFYKEKIRPRYRESRRLFSNGTNNLNLADYLYNDCSASISNNISYTSYTMDFAPTEMSRKIDPKMEETGRIEKGNTSNQKFESVSMDFENYITNTISYQILPESKRPITTSEIKQEFGNNFCTECGNKINNKDKFCRNCGTRLV